MDIPADLRTDAYVSVPAAAGVKPPLGVAATGEDNAAGQQEGAE
jgi:hypothetical protein